MTVRRLSLALALLLAPAAAHGIDLPVTLRDGATWTQTSERTRTDTRNGVTQSMKGVSVVKATYKNVSGAETLRLDFVSFDAEGADAADRSALSAQAKLVYPAVLEVDESLMPTRVQDWERVRETIFQALAGSVPDARALEAAKASFMAMDDSRAATLFREQGLVGLGQGTGLELGETRTYDSEVPNLMGGPPIKATGAFRLESVDKAAGRAVLTWHQRPDPSSIAESLKVSLEAMVAKAAPDKQAEARRAFADLVLERQEGCRYEIDLPTGLAMRTDCSIETRSGFSAQVAHRTERWVITQTLPEPR